jgi:hypothetical protein
MRGMLRVMSHSAQAQLAQSALVCPLSGADTPRLPAVALLVVAAGQAVHLLPPAAMAACAPPSPGPPAIATVRSKAADSPLGAAASSPAPAPASVVQPGPPSLMTVEELVAQTAACGQQLMVLVATNPASRELWAAAPEVTGAAILRSDCSGACGARHAPSALEMSPSVAPAAAVAADALGAVMDACLKRSLPLLVVPVGPAASPVAEVAAPACQGRGQPAEAQAMLAQHVLAQAIVALGRSWVPGRARVERLAWLGRDSLPSLAWLPRHTQGAGAGALEDGDRPLDATATPHGVWTDVQW